MVSILVRSFLPYTYYITEYKNTPRDRGIFVFKNALTLRELFTLTSRTKTVFFTFFFTWVT